MQEYMIFLALFVVACAFFVGRASKPGTGWKAPYDRNLDFTRGNQDSDYQGP